MELNLNELRDEINQVDMELTKLLEKRFNLVLKVALYKRTQGIAVYDPSREQAVIDRCKSYLKNPRYDIQIEKLYHAIMDAAKEIEREEIKEA